MSTETVREEGLYYSVIEGTLRRKVEPDTPGALRREYEKKDKSKGVKYELVIDALEGFIEDIQVYEDGEFGHQMKVTLDPNAQGKNPVIQFSLETNYGRDVLAKVPGIDFTKPVYFRPFAFEADGRDIRGVEIKQGDEKVANQFWDKEAKKSLLGAPEPEGNVDEYTTDDWKIFYLKRNKFQREYFAKEVYPRFLEEKKVPREQVVKDDATYEPSPEEMNEIDDEVPPDEDY